MLALSHELVPLLEGMAEGPMVQKDEELSLSDT
jgi:hypothetical protein